MFAHLSRSPRLALVVLSSVTFVTSAPLSSIVSEKDATGVAQALSSGVDVYRPYTSLAGAAYCPLSSWSCGAYCDNLSSFELHATGGNGKLNPYWYVGYAPTLGEIVVGHQGTNTSDFLSILNNVDFIRAPLPPTHFPGVPPDATVHTGFLATVVSLGPGTLAAVQQLLQSSDSKSVVVVGHSMGAATAILNSLYLKLHLDSDISLKTIVFAAPRVGNGVFADLVDNMIPDLHHINNKKDPVPTLPPRWLGYAHSSGEVHISEDGTWYACPDHDTAVANCTIASVPNLFVSNPDDHVGPYAGTYLGFSYCS